eukprot:2932676-Prymnesium_polylepis.1
MRPAAASAAAERLARSSWKRTPASAAAPRIERTCTVCPPVESTTKSNFDSSRGSVQLHECPGSLPYHPCSVSCRMKPTLARLLQFSEIISAGSNASVGQ